MYDRMIREHGYSIRKLAEKLGKDKGYLENRLRLADAPPEVRELVSLRKDTLSHAYELMKVAGPEEAPPACRPGRSQRAVAGQAPREDRGPARPDGRRRGGSRPSREVQAAEPAEDAGGWDGRERVGIPIADDSLVAAKQQLNEAVEELLGVIREPGRPRRDRPDRPGEPRQVPDDREAPARERDRRGPDGRHGPLGRSARRHEEAGAEAPASSIRGDRPGSVCPWPPVARPSRRARAAARSALAASRSAFAVSFAACFSRVVAPCPASRRRTPRA